MAVAVVAEGHPVILCILSGYRAVNAAAARDDGSWIRNTASVALPEATDHEAFRRNTRDRNIDGFLPVRIGRIEGMKEGCA